MLRAVSLALVFACFALSAADQQRKKPPAKKPAAPEETGMILGLRTVVYHVDDLGKAKQWYAAVLGRGPYFDEPFYVGFEVGGYELGLHPGSDPGEGAKAYWGVADADAALAALLGRGAREHEPVRDVGGGIRTASVLEPAGAVLGIIENPHFRSRS